jgi:ATP-dependent DNA helicase RecG
VRTLPTTETLTIEFKSDAHGGLSDNDLVLAVVCLANAQGGTLYLGVEDDGRITGIADRHRDPSRVAAMIFNTTQPPQSVRVSIIEEEGKQVAEIQVDRCDRPVSNQKGTFQRRRLRSDGKPECAPFLSHEFLTRASDLAQLDYTSLPVDGATVADLDPKAREDLRAAIETYKGDRTLLDLSDGELDGALRLVEDGVPTVAGLLLLGREEAIRRRLPTHEIAFQVLTDTKAVRVNDFYRGPLLSVFEAVEAQFKARVNEQELQVGMFRVSVPDVSPEAFREAFVNAIIHRDYTRLGAIHVQWDADSLSISNPGGFVDGVFANRLLVTRPRHRNPLLADAFKRIGLSERTGRGVDKIFAGTLRAGLPAPSYAQSDASAVVVEMRCSDADLSFVRMIVEEERRRGAPLSLDALIALSSVRDQGRCGIEQVTAALQKDETAARAAVERLVEAGLLIAHGTRRRIYTLSPSLYRAMGMASGSVRQAGFDALQQSEMVRSYVKQHGRIRRADVIELCRLSPDEAKRLLSRLESEGVLVMHGERRGAWYSPGPRA